MIIRMEKVTKQYQTRKGILNRYNKKTVNAISNLDLSVRQGEILGYIGVNGAGKSTTIKMMTGILVPTQGEVHVLGMNPHSCRRKVVREIGVVFGQRSQLIWDLPPIDSFNLNASIYDISKEEYMLRRNDLIKYMEVEEIVSVPVRKLSLGQRMCCEIIASLLHNPKILFLDEPTIGLDIINKDKIRKLIKRVNEDRGTTIILTTHDMDDVEDLCTKIVVVDKGRLLFDGSLEKIRTVYGNEDVILLETSTSDLIAYNDLVNKYKCVVDKVNDGIVIRNDRNIARTMDVVRYITNKISDIRGITVKHMSIEDIVKKIYVDGGR